ncbi:MAG: tRNA-dihydrouridine(20/20a) synthase DusA [Gammaproteobacteria bacterium]
MMDWTDRHCRYFLRGFSPSVLLYTEMITSSAILRGDRDRLLAFDTEEHPVALQLGGSEPADLARAARAGEEAGYDEINLNCGCPSDRVASGAFGACLMLEPQRVADSVAAMKAAVKLPITVKMRIGVVEAKQRGVADNHRAAETSDTSGSHGTANQHSKPKSHNAAIAQVSEQDFAALHHFVTLIKDAGCEAAIVHARKAVLGGLSPKENREIPPLRYDIVRNLKREFPGLPVIVNGGLRDVPTTLDALTWSDGVMLGREAYHRPMLLAELESALNPAAQGGSLTARESTASPGPATSSQTPLTREQVLDRMSRYASRELARGERLSSITRHMLGLYAGQPGARDYRRTLSEGARALGAGAELIRKSVPGRAGQSF